MYCKSQIHHYLVLVFAVSVGCFVALPGLATSESEYISSSPELRELMVQIKKHPRDAGAYFHRATLWDRFFEYELAAKDCSQPIALKPSVNAYLLRAKMLASSGKNNAQIDSAPASRFHRASL